MADKDYLVFRDGPSQWRFPEGNTPGQIRIGESEWQDSVCSPRDFFVPADDGELFDVLEPNFTVGIERMSE